MASLHDQKIRLQAQINILEDITSHDRIKVFKLPTTLEEANLRVNEQVRQLLGAFIAVAQAKLKELE